MKLTNKPDRTFKPPTGELEKGNVFPTGIRVFDSGRPEGDKFFEKTRATRRGLLHFDIFKI